MLYCGKGVDFMSILGFDRQDITPEIGCFLYGYVDDLRSESIHDRLNVNVFYFKDESSQALLISAEVCSINSVFSKKMREVLYARTGVPTDCIIIHGIHNHTGPNTDGNTGWGKLDIDYCENILLPATLKAAENAVKSAKPALVGANMGESLVGVNRREQTVDNRVNLGQCEWGCFDPRMAVFSFKTIDGAPIANLVYYTCHGTCAGVNTAISRDWAGGMIDALDRHTGVPTAFFCGAEGDVGPRLSNGKTVGTIKDVEIMGAKAGADAVRIFDGINEYKPLEFFIKNALVKLPLKRRIDKEDALEKLMEFRNHKVNLEGQIRDYCERVLKSYENDYVDEKSREIEQAIFGIGDNIFVAFPFELFSEIALRINKAKKGFEVFSLSNANGSEGYFPTEGELPKGGYEIDMFLTNYIQPYLDNADWHLIKETLKNLEEFKCTE